MRNNVQLIGHIGSISPKSKEYGNVNFKIIVHDTYQNAMGEVVSSDIEFDCVAWGKVAEIAEKYLSPKTIVAVAGKLTPNKLFLEITVQEIMVL